MNAPQPATGHQQAAQQAYSQSDHGPDAGGSAGHPPANQRVGQLYFTRNSLPEPVRTNSIAELNQALADLIVLRSQLEFAHWNVKGLNFYQLHEFFDEIAATADAHIDTIAERTTALGGQALGTVGLAVSASTLPELATDQTSEVALLEQIADNLATVDTRLYHGIEAVSNQGDLDTADLLNEVSRDISKALGFLEAHLQDRPIAAPASQSPQP